MNYVEFFGGSYFVAWCSLWLFWVVVPIVQAVFKVVNITLRGWPPEHLNADGDWGPEPEQVRNEKADDQGRINTYTQP